MINRQCTETRHSSPSSSFSSSSCCLRSQVSSSKHQRLNKMVQTIEIEGFDAFAEKTESLQAAGKTIFAYFSASKDSSGKSWCPDCVVAEPVVKAALAKAPQDAVFLYVGVGGRNFWKDPNCIFRTDSRTRLRSVPTLLKIGGSQRLEEDQCAKADMVEMLFED